jgi:hypothetical protein
MNTLREAVREYLSMRRDLGFKLRDASKALIDFVDFLEHHDASYITQSLALAWAQRPSHTQPAHWAQRLPSHAVSPVTVAPPIRVRRFRHRVSCPTIPNGHGLFYTPMTKFATYFAPRSG